MRRILFAALLALSISPTFAQSVDVRHDQHTGETIIQTKRLTVKNGLLNGLNAYVGHSSRLGYGVATEYIGTGGNWIFFKEAWSYGNSLNYRVGAENVMGCGAGCTLQETGLISLSERQFKQAAQDGLAFKLVGLNGSIEGSIPASAFKAVLAKMN